MARRDYDAGDRRGEGISDSQDKPLKRRSILELPFNFFFFEINQERLFHTNFSQTVSCFFENRQ